MRQKRPGRRMERHLKGVRRIEHRLRQVRRIVETDSQLPNGAGCGEPADKTRTGCSAPRRVLSPKSGRWPQPRLDVRCQRYAE